MDDMKKAFLMEPYLQHGRSTLSPFFFARDGSIRNVFKFHIKDIQVTLLIEDNKRAFLMEPYLKHGRSTLSPFIFARDGSIGPRRSRPICSSQFPPTSGGLMKRQTHHMEITRVAHIVLCYVPTHTNSMPSVLELKRSRIDTCLLCINSALRLPFVFKDGSIDLNV